MNVVNRLIGSAGVVCAGVAMLIAFGAAGPAAATPTDDSAQASCVYTLSKPFLVDVSGRTFVSATFTALPCTGHILPNQQTVCVEIQGGGSAPTCAYQPGSRVQVYAPYRPGATYISTGIGCGAVAPTNTSTCDTKGPVSVTL